MPAARPPETIRRSVVPQAAGRSPWLAAVWTGVGTAVIAAVAAIAVVAVCWLPASHGSGNATSAIKAGLLTFLASVHGGITVNGTDAAFLPLGLTLLLGAIAWRAGSGLADAVAERDESDVFRLLLIGATQTVSFVAACLLLVPVATLGTSTAPFVGVGIFSIVVFSLTGGIAYVRGTALGVLIAAALPQSLRSGARIACIGLCGYLSAGALLVAGSLVWHRHEAQDLMSQVGPGWNGVPILLLCLLAAPNAAVAGAAYLSGPGFAVGTGTVVGVHATTHGVLPAFPVLAALPSGHSPHWMWWPVVLVPLLAGWWSGRAAMRTEGWLLRLRTAGIGAAIAGIAAAVLAWQGGGGIGDARLATIGASPWQFGLAVAAELATGAALALAVAGIVAVLRPRRPALTPVLWARRPAGVVDDYAVEDDVEEFDADDADLGDAEDVDEDAAEDTANGDVEPAGVTARTGTTSAEREPDAAGTGASAVGADTPDATEGDRLAG